MPSVAENSATALRLAAVESISVPWENFVFLVDGKPILCFWGFVNLNENARDDVLDCLRESLIPEPAPVVIEDPEPEPEPERVPEPAITFEKADEPLIAPVAAIRITPEDLYAPEPAPVVAQPAPEPAPVVITKKRRVPLWTLPVAAVIVAAIAAPLMWPKSALLQRPRLRRSLSPWLSPQNRSKPLSHWR